VSGEATDVEDGWVADEVRAEFPRLFLRHLSVGYVAGRSGAAVRERLSRMSDRFTGAKAVALRLEPVPSAYRAFFRQVGIDPDHRRTPAEDVALQRMKDGGYLSRGRLEDALTIAIAETAVPVLAFDAAGVEGPPGVRLSRRGERLGREGRSVAAGSLVLADPERPVAVLFGDRAEEVSVGRGTSTVLLVGVGVKGVSSLTVEEALWTAAGVLGTGS
jgi:DNA/RNA-binding domain of Phe-tRNA-synthetase-like protein